MKVSDILRVKGNTLYRCNRMSWAGLAAEIMADNTGSLVVMEHGDLSACWRFAK
jgi:hypothetical protein